MERERRGHARKRSSAGVTFRGREGVPLHGLLVDVSRGGCFISSPSTMPPGESVDLELRLSDVPLQVTGRVVWTRETTERDRPAGMGVSFLEVPDTALRAIDKLGSEARLSRPNTIIGIAPAPRASVPSYNPPPLEPEPPPAPAPGPEPSPPPPVAPKKSRLPWLVLGGVASLGIVAVGIFLVTRRHHPPATMTVVDAAAPVTSAVPTVDAGVTPELDAGLVHDAEAVDAAAPRKRPKTKPRRH